MYFYLVVYDSKNERRFLLVNTDPVVAGRTTETAQVEVAGEVEGRFEGDNTAEMEGNNNRPEGSTLDQVEVAQEDIVADQGIDEVLSGSSHIEVASEGHRTQDVPAVGSPGGKMVDLRVGL